jgi:hypothetical protein
MRYSFHPEARDEFIAAIEYYESCKFGLGLEFSEEIYRTIQRVLCFPNAWTSLSLSTRRCLTQRFPFGVIYSVEKDTILIIGIMQLNRKPDYWNNRL